MIVDDSAKKEPGIYCIEFLLDGRIYLGSSNKVSKRLKNHNTCLKKGNHRNSNLQEAYNLFGEECFIGFVMEYCDSKDQFMREQVYLDLFLHSKEFRETKGTDERFIELGFNICPIATGSRGIRKNKTQIEIQSRIQKNLWKDESYRNSMIEKRNSPDFKAMMAEIRKNSKAIAAMQKPVLVYNRHTGEFIKEYLGARQCAKDLKMDWSRISKILRGDRRYDSGMHFKYKTEENYPLKTEPIPQYKDIEKRKESLKNGQQGRRHSVLQFDMNDQFVGEHLSPGKAAQSLGKKWLTGNISKSAKGDQARKFVGGFKWRFKKDVSEFDYLRIQEDLKNPKPIQKKNRGNLLLMYDRFTGQFIEEIWGIDLKRKYGIKNDGSVTHHLNGKTSYVKEYIFKYKENEIYPLSIPKFAQSKT